MNWTSETVVTGIAFQPLEKPPGPAQPHRGMKFLLPATRHLLEVVEAALCDAQIGEAPYAPNAVGVAIGTNHANREFLERMYRGIAGEGLRFVDPMDATHMSVNLSAGHVSIHNGFKAFNLTCTSSITGGMEALLIAREQIESGRAAMAVAGALEGPLPGTTRNECSSVVLIVEKAETAKLRGARIYGYVGQSMLNVYSVSKDVHLGRGRLAGRLARDIRELLPRGIARVRLHFVHGPTAISAVMMEALLDALSILDVRAAIAGDAGKGPADGCVAPLNVCAASLLASGEGAGDEEEGSLIAAAGPDGELALQFLKGGCPATIG